MKNNICIGKIVRSFGVKGEMKIMPYVSYDQIENIKKFYNNNVCYKYELTKKQNKFLIIKIDGIDSPEEATKLNGKEMFVEKLEKKESKITYLVKDLIGTELVNLENKVIGKIVDIENFGAGDIIVFKMDKKECRVPFLDNIFSKIDISSKKIVVSDKFFEVIV